MWKYLPIRAYPSFTGSHIIPNCTSPCALLNRSLPDSAFLPSTLPLHPKTSFSTPLFFVSLYYLMRLTAPWAGEDVTPLEHPHGAGGNANQENHWENDLAVSTKLLCAPEIPPKRNEWRCPPKDTYKNAHSSTTQNKQKQEATTSSSTGDWISKLWYIHIMGDCTVIKHKLQIRITT